MMMLFRISVQMVCGTFYCPPGLQLSPDLSNFKLPVYFYLITGLAQLDCFDNSVCSRKVFCLF